MTIIKDGVVPDNIKNRYKVAKKNCEDLKNIYIDKLVDMPKYQHCSSSNSRNGCNNGFGISNEYFIGQEDERDVLELVKAHTDFRIACFELMEAEEDFDGYMP